MPNPVIYEAAREAMDQVGAAVAPSFVPNVPVITLDPLRSFERERDLLKTDLNNWRTFQPKDREAKVRSWVNAPDFFKEESKHRILNYIIWIESMPGGDRDTAAVAFNALLPEKSKKPEGK